MLHLAIDTNILRSDPNRKKAAFQALTQLSQAKVVQVYIPYIVQQEFLSQEKERYQKCLEDIISGIHKLKKLPLPGETIFCLDKNIEYFKNAQLELNEFTDESLQAWCDKTGTEILSVHMSHGQKVIDSYFRGELPFKKPKNRDDFPDAFIWQAILDLSENLEELYIITKDNNLSRSLLNRVGIVPLETLDDFIELEICQHAIQKLEFESGNKESNVQANRQKLINILETHESLLLYPLESELIREFQDKAIKSSEIPSDDHEATIKSIGNIESLNLSLDQIKYYGSNVFVIPFSLRVETLLVYLIDKSEYWLFLQEEIEQISTDCYGDQVYSIGEEYSLLVEGRLSILLTPNALKKENLSDEELIELVEDSYSLLENSSLSDEDLIKIVENSRLMLDSVDEISITQSQPS